MVLIKGIRPFYVYTIHEDIVPRFFYALVYHQNDSLGCRKCCLLYTDGVFCGRQYEWQILIHVTGLFGVFVLFGTKRGGNQKKKNLSHSILLRLLFDIIRTYGISATMLQTFGSLSIRMIMLFYKCGKIVP